MKWKKSIASLALAGCMLASSVPAVAFAANETVIEQTVKADASELNKLVIVGDTTAYLANGKDTNFKHQIDTITVSTLSQETIDGIKVEVDDEDEVLKEVPTVTWDGKSGSFSVIANENGNTGTATITLTAQDSDDKDIEEVATATYTVHVDDEVYIESIEAEEKEYTIENGKTLEPEYKILPENANQVVPKVTWTVDGAESGPSAEFTIDSTKLEGSKFTANARGTATIVGNWAQGKDKTPAEFSFNVTVTRKDSEETPLTVGTDDEKDDVTTAGSLEIDIGDTETVTAYYKGQEETVTWSSDSTSIATIDQDGKITGVGAGTAYITGEAADGLTVGFKVTVTDPALKATGVALENTTLTMAQGEEDGLIGVVVTPAGADATIASAGTITVNGEPVNGDDDSDDTAKGITIIAKTNKKTSVVGYEVTVAGDAKVGSYTIRIPVKYTADGKTSDTITLVCTLTVTEPGVAAAQTLTLKSYKDIDLQEATEANIFTNTTVPMVADPTPDKSDNSLVSKKEAIVDVLEVFPTSLESQIIYSIANSEIAKIVELDGDPYVVGLKAGTTILTARLGDKLTQAIELTVSDPEDADSLTGIKLSQAVLGLNLNKNTTLAVKYQLNKGTYTESLGSDAPQSVYTPIWSSDNEEIAKVDKNGKVTAVGAGTANITVTVGNYSATCTVIVVDPNAKPDVKPEPEVPTFDDVADGTWYKDAVSAVVAEGWMDGTADKIFEPETNLSRAMAAQILWAKNNKPYVKYEGKFSDVETNDWYANAISWASSKGIVSGRSDTIFDPKGDISRQDFALMLFKEENATAPENTTALDKYADKNEIAEYAAPAFAWAVEKGIISGVGENAENARPTWTMTRAQAAQMFSHLIPTEEA